MLMVFDVVVWKLALFAIGETGTVLRACPCLALYRSYQFSQLVDNRDVFSKLLVIHLAEGGPRVNVMALEMRCIRDLGACWASTARFCKSFTF